MLNVQRVRKSCSQRLQLKHYTIIFIDIDICKKKNASYTYFDVAKEIE